VPWLAAAILLAATVLALPARPFTAPPPAWKPSHAEVRGVFHIHSKRSDGTGTIDEIAAAAAAAGLQFVIVTDHGDGSRLPDQPAYRSGVLCIDAVEISTTGGHYAAIGLGRTPYPLGGEPRDVVEDVRRLGGHGVATHPLSVKSELEWRDWTARMDSVEWLNGDSLWREAPSSRLAASAWTYLLSPIASVARLYQRPTVLSKWDSLERGWRVTALAGTDAHARLGFADGPEPYEKPVYLKVPSYRVAFGLASLRVATAGALTGRAADDAAAVVEAIRKGRVHTVVDGLGRDGSFEFTATSGGVQVGEGGQVLVTDPAVIRVRSNPPPGGWVVLFLNGMQVHRVKEQELVYASDREGTYRAEVWAPAPGRSSFLPWIVSNPIIVGSVATPSAPPPADASGEAVTIPDGAGWTVEHDSRSRGTLERDGGVGLAYSLGAANATSPFAALAADVAIRQGSAGIAFVGRADRPMRVSVQVRVPAEGEGLRWRRSVYLETNPREVFIPFGEMTPVGPSLRGKPQLGEIRSLLFVVDLVNSSPGSSGRFALKDVRFYSPGGLAAGR
jgi:hypothetical protein